MVIGRIIGGSVGDKLIIRLKNESNVDVGDLLIIEDKGLKFYVKVINKSIASLVPGQFIEEIAGQNLEYDESINLFDEKERFYQIAFAKILTIDKNRFVPPRTIPSFFAKVSKVSSDDFKFLEKKGEIEIGCLRLGTESLKSVKIKLPAKDLVSHHMLVTAATGKGKSNFVRVFIRGLLKTEGFASLIIDPHAEYYGSKGMKGLSHLPDRNKIYYFTPRWQEVMGSYELKIFAEDLKPADFHGIIELSDAQKEAMDALYKVYGEVWIRALLVDESINNIYDKLSKNVSFATLYALRRRIGYTLELEDGESGLVFDTRKREGASIFEKIRQAVKDGKTVIIDTSLLGSEAEKLTSAGIARRQFNFYRRTKQVNPDAFDNLPELLIVFEEAPRVLGVDALRHGTNVFEKIAREGRKFHIGICAITQMPSLIPKEILSQMNTKVILGIPAPMDRNAVIESSAQNISDESVEIQMLDKGEAIVTSPFIDFPLPVKVSFFDDLVREDNSYKRGGNPELVGL